MADPGMTEPIKVVYVEDDERLARLTAQYLENHGVEVLVVSSGAFAVSAVLDARPDLVLLDLMLPEVDGVEVCKQLRERVDLPILMVSARTEEADRVIGLEGAGADDYINKPFSTRELLARIRSNVRRARGRAGPRKQRLCFRELVIDTASLTATMAGRRLSLTTTEFSLLRVLAERCGRVLSRQQLQDLIQGTVDDTFDRSIDVHVSRLRQKMEADRRHPTYIKTVRGAGYVLVDEKS